MLKRPQEMTLTWFATKEPGERGEENALTTVDKANAVVGGQGTLRYLEMEIGVSGNGQGKFCTIRAVSR